jgi:hypothetical protein
MHKNRIESICRAAGMRPEGRKTIKGHEVFVADGFSLMPHNAYRRFGVEPDEYPGGMYVTLWWASKGDEKLDTGQPLFFQANHDPQYDAATKKQARINTAFKTAAEFIERRRKVH